MSRYKATGRGRTDGWAGPSSWGNIPWEARVTNLHAASLGNGVFLWLRDQSVTLCFPRASMGTSSCGLSRRSMLPSSHRQPRIPKVCGGPLVSWTYLALKISRTIGIKILTCIAVSENCIRRARETTQSVQCLSGELELFSFRAHGESWARGQWHVLVMPVLDG